MCYTGCLNLLIAYIINFCVNVYVLSLYTRFALIIVSTMAHLEGVHTEETPTRFARVGHLTRRILYRRHRSGFGITFL